MLFSTPMVQALLKGTKTQTRRIIKKKKSFEGDKDNPSERNNPLYYSVDGFELEESVPLALSDIQKVNVGDIIWVRETFRQYYEVDAEGYTDFDKQIIEYKADNPLPVVLADGDGFAELNKNGEEKYVPWKPSLFMPKSACRLFLKVTNVRVERLNDISESDAICEGIESIGKNPEFGGVTYSGEFFENYGKTGYSFLKPIESYKSLWEKINGKDSWEENPFVWVYEFEVLTERPEGFV